MRCINCGSPLPEEAKYCPSCGLPVMAECALPPEAPSEPESIPMEGPQEAAPYAPEQRWQSPPPSAPEQRWQTPASPYPAWSGMPSEPVPPMPREFLFQNIFLLLCCCSPIGLVGLIYSAMVATAHKNGEYGKAKDYARVARLLFWIGFGIGIVMLVVGLIILGLIAGEDLWRNYRG